MNSTLVCKLPTVSLLLVGLTAPAMAQALRPLTNGQVADATDVMANFTTVDNKATAAQSVADAVQGAISNLAGQVNPLLALFNVGNGDFTVPGRVLAPQMFASSAIGSSNDAALNAITTGLNGNGVVARANNGPTAWALWGQSTQGQAAHLDGHVEVTSPHFLQFGPLGENSDPVYFQRESSGNNLTLMTLVLGDDPIENGTAKDTFRIVTRGVDGSGTNTRFVFNSDGNAFKAGTQSGWGTVSDERLKHDIQPLAGALDRLLQLEGRTYYYNNPDMLGAGPGLRMGFVAQQVEQVFPEWVGEFEGYKSLGIFGFEALTVESLRTMVDTDKALANENAALRQRVDELSAELAALKTALAPLLAK